MCSSDLAGLLRDQCRTTDVVARVGGEEFGLVLAATDAEGGRGLAEKLRLGIGGLSVAIAGGALVRVTASLGLATAQGRNLQSTDDAIELIGLADAALYAAKRAGRDRVVAAPPWHEEALPEPV